MESITRQPEKVQLTPVVQLRDMEEKLLSLQTGSVKDALI